MVRFRLCALATLGIWLSFVSNSIAGSVQPSQPSSVVQLYTSNNTCLAAPETANATVDLIGNPDGTIKPFSIPTGKVLVVTGVEWIDNDVFEGSPEYFRLYRVNGTNFNPLFEAIATADAAGAHGVAEIPLSVIKSGTQLCAVFSPRASGP